MGKLNMWWRSPIEIITVNDLKLFFNIPIKKSHWKHFEFRWKKVMAKYFWSADISFTMQDATSRGEVMKKLMINRLIIIIIIRSLCYPPLQGIGIFQSTRVTPRNSNRFKSLPLFTCQFFDFISPLTLFVDIYVPEYLKINMRPCYFLSAPVGR